MDYLRSLPAPIAPWGQLAPHRYALFCEIKGDTHLYFSSPLEGIYAFAQTTQRKIPTCTNDITHEHVHPSVLEQKTLLPVLREAIKADAKLVTSLLPLEEQVKCTWKLVKEVVSSYVEGKPAVVRIAEDLGLMKGKKEEVSEKEKDNLKEKKDASPLLKAVKDLTPDTSSPSAAEEPKKLEKSVKEEKEKDQGKSKPDNNKTDDNKMESGKSESNKTESSKKDSNKTDSNKTDKANKRSSRILGAVKGLMNEVTSKSSHTS